VLAVDSIDLPLSGGLREQGTQKELAEPETTSRVSDPCLTQCVVDPDNVRVDFGPLEPDPGGKK
jgi:hypothetical protein